MRISFSATVLDLFICVINPYLMWNRWLTGLVVRHCSICNLLILLYGNYRHQQFAIQVHPYQLGLQHAVYGVFVCFKPKYSVSFGNTGI
jgi:hypothetical protein